MTNERYPQDLPISIRDFVDSGWKEVIAEASREGYLAMWLALSAAARDAITQGRNEQGKVLWLLADVCSMTLSPSSPNEPFKPFMVMGGQHSVIPDDLSDANIEFFGEIVNSIDDVWLRARIADLVWLKKIPRNTSFALIAVDSYRTIPLNAETWTRGGRECWERAIGLALILKRVAGDRLNQMEASIIDSFDGANRQDGFLGLELADLLKSKGLGKSHQTDLAKKLEALAREFDIECDLDRAGEYFSSAADWYSLIPDASKAAEMTALKAENFVKKAVTRISSNSPNHMVAASFYENAIQTYRTIPKAERSAHRVDERIAELRADLNASGEKSLTQMGTIRSPPIDITQLVEKARNSVTGKSAQEALLAFTNLHSGANAKKLRHDVLESMRRHPFRSMLPATMMSHDGHVIAKRSGFSAGENITKNDEAAIHAEMINNYSRSIGLVVQGIIGPALEVILLEHRLREDDFVGLARQSPIVPKDRAGLFGKALFFGYECDFVIALHILIPQIENLARVHLKQAGAQTTNIDKDGIQNENGMSTLMDLPEAEKIFGKDLTFELKALFCDAFGPNLRNKLAHGLLDEDSCHSIFGIYAWWFALKLIFITWWNSRHKNAIEEQA